MQEGQTPEWVTLYCSPEAHMFVEVLVSIGQHELYRCCDIMQLHTLHTLLGIGQMLTIDLLKPAPDLSTRSA